MCGTLKKDPKTDPNFRELPTWFFLDFTGVVSGIRDLPWPCDLWTLGRFKMLGLWCVRVGFEVSGVLGFRVLGFEVSGKALGLNIWNRVWGYSIIYP